MAVIDSLLVELGFKADSKDAKKFGKSIKEVKSTFRELGKVVIGITGGLFLLGRGFAETSEKIDLSAKRAGLTTKQFQDLAGAAQIAGINQDVFTNSLQQFNFVLGKATLGSGPGIQAFGLLGISLNKANGKAKTTSNLLLEVSNRLKDLPKSERISVAQDLGFTAESLSVLQLGGKELKKLEAQFQATGDVISKQGIEKGIQYNETMKLLEDNVGGVKKTIEFGLLPVIAKMTDGFEQWFKTNKKIITQGIISFIKEAARAVKVFLFFLTDLGKALNALLAPIGGIATGVKIFLGLLVAQKLFKIVAAVLAMVKAFKELRAIIVAVDIVSLLNPVGLVIAAVAALGTAVFFVTKNMGALATKGASDLTSLFEKIPPVTKAIEGFFGKVAANTFGLIERGIKDIESFFDKVISKIEALKNKVTGVLSKLPFVGKDFKNTQKVQSTQFVSLLGTIKPGASGQALANTNKIANTVATSVVNATINITDSPASQVTAKAVLDILNNNSRQAQRNLANPVRG